MISIPKPRKPKSLTFYKNKLWKLLSLYIRLRDANENLMMRCVTCEEEMGKEKSKLLSYKQLQAGHFITSIHYATRWEEDNIHPQCGRCNKFKEGNREFYQKFMEKRYGKARVDELIRLSRIPVKFTRDWYEQKIEFYRGMVERWIGEVR